LIGRDSIKLSIKFDEKSKVFISFVAKYSMGVILIIGNLQKEMQDMCIHLNKLYYRIKIF